MKKLHWPVQQNTESGQSSLYFRARPVFGDGGFRHSRQPSADVPRRHCRQFFGRKGFINLDVASRAIRSGWAT